LIRPTQTGAIDKKWACEGIKFSLKTFCGHLPGVHFDTPIQKVRGYVGGFTSYVRITTNQKYSFVPRQSSGKLPPFE
jgi:hypothetical protein